LNWKRLNNLGTNDHECEVYMRGSLYPGVTTTAKDSTYKVEHMSKPEDRQYLCVAYDIEQTSIQPLRLAAVPAGLMVAYSSRMLPEDKPVMRTAVGLTGLAMTAWSGFIWYKANKEITEGLERRKRGLA
jgi:hypothetical protein